MDSGACAVCKIPAKKACSACNSAFYCSKEHQKIDWKGHKPKCCPYTVLTNETFGRYLVAIRDIQAGETVIRKKPILLAPKTFSYPLCLGCHKRINIDGKYLCSKCKWPVCNEVCEESSLHTGECRIFAENRYNPTILFDGSKQTAYSAIAPLRALLLQKQDPKKYETLSAFQDNLVANLNTPLYNILKRTLPPLFTDVLKQPTTGEEVLKLCSVFDTNAFEVRDPRGLVNVRGLYPAVSLMAHACRHNTRHCFRGGDFEIVVSATVPIAKGEMITTTYTQTLWSTPMRRAHLRAAKQFECGCLRCGDPTEFGVYAGAVYCGRCGEGDGGGGAKIVSKDPLRMEAEWGCAQCGCVVSAQQVLTGTEALRKEVREIDRSDPRNFEQFLEKYSRLLHPTNTHLLEVKYALAQMYGNMKGFMLSDLSEGLLARKIELCEELMRVADVLEPGLSRFRGLLLYDLQAAMVVLAKRNYCSGRISKEDAQTILENALKLMQEAATILSSEPDMKETLREKLENLDQYLEL